MSFIASLAAAGTAIASGAAAVGGTLAAGAGAIGSGLAAGAGALGSGIGALGTGLASGAGAVSSGLASGASALGSGLGIGAGSAAGAGAGAAGAGGAGFAGLAGGTGLTAGAGAGGIGSLGAAGSSALGSSLTAGSLGLTSAGGAAGATGAGLGAAAAPGLGAAMGATGAGTALPMAASLGGSGLAAPSMLGSIGEFATAHPIMTSAGVGALGGAVTNPNDPLGGAIKGGAAGAIGGWGAGELGGMAGSGGALGKIGSFAAEHPGITSAGIGMLASPIVGAITPSFSSNKDADLSQMNETDRQNFLRYMRNYTPSLAPGYAAGGITDLDGYMSNAQNIPNPQEVADPEGYGSNSMRLMAGGGIADLGGYAAGGIPNLLHGPGDGVSDDIPASIAGKQPARLASGEYVIPSRIVSELGNGSTDAGAKRLDMMVQKVNAGRAQTLGGKKYAKDTRAYKHLPV